MKNSREFLNNNQTASGFSPRLKVFVTEYLKYKSNQKRELNILDIGCGHNCELLRFSAKDDKYYACDFYKKLNVEIENYNQIDLNEENISDKFENIKFDVIFCGEVIEHLFSPDRLLEEIKKLMHSESILLLSTPNLAYLPNRIFLLFGISPLFLENSSELKLGRKFKFLGQMNKTEGHIRLFTYGAIKDLIKLKHFKIDKVISTPSWNIFNLDKIICFFSKSLAPNNVFILKKSDK